MVEVFDLNTRVQILKRAAVCSPKFKRLAKVLAV